MADYTWFSNKGEAIRFLQENGWKYHPPSNIWRKGNKKAEIQVVQPGQDVRVYWLQS